MVTVSGASGCDILLERMFLAMDAFLFPVLAEDTVELIRVDGAVIALFVPLRIACLLRMPSTVLVLALDVESVLTEKRPCNVLCRLECH